MVLPYRSLFRKLLVYWKRTAFLFVNTITYYYNIFRYVHECVCRNTTTRNKQSTDTLCCKKAKPKRFASFSAVGCTKPQTNRLGRSRIPNTFVVYLWSARNNNVAVQSDLCAGSHWLVIISRQIHTLHYQYSNRRLAVMPIYTA